MGMTNKELIEKLKQIGKLPSETICDKIDFSLKAFDELLQMFTLPIDFETAYSWLISHRRPTQLVTRLSGV